MRPPIARDLASMSKRVSARSDRSTSARGFHRWKSNRRTNVIVARFRGLHAKTDGNPMRGARVTVGEMTADGGAAAPPSRAR
jgi:hypothetical protein